MSYRKINNTFSNHVNAIPNFPKLIKENERGFIVSSDTSGIHNSLWSRISMIPSPTGQSTLGEIGRNFWSGEMQVDIFTPSNQGSDGADYFVDALIDAFPAKVALGVPDESWKIHIRSVSRVISQQNTNYYMVPVRILFEAYIRR